MPTTMKIGLAPKKVGFYDPKTKLHLMLDMPFKEITVPDGADLSGLARGLFSLRPAIVLLEGTFPEAEKDKFKERYNIPFKAMTRTDAIVASAPVAGQSTKEATLFDVDQEPAVEDAPADPVVKAESEGEAQVLEGLDEEPTPAAKKPTTKKGTSNKKKES